MTKKSALAPGFTVDTTALNSNAQALLATPDVATGGRRQAPSDSSSRQQASSDEQQAASAKPRASSSSI